MDTNSAGDYVFTLLPIGTYSVAVEASGFKKFLTTSVTLVAGDRTRVDAKMQVGEISQSVEVNGQAALLQTDSATMNATVTTTAVQDLPTNGRNFIQLVQINAGMNDADQGLSGGTSPDDRRQTSGFSANGQNGAANNFMLDGMDNNERAIGTVVVKPSIDALAEIQVQSSLYPASVGRAGGAVVNQITKSGANSFHGTVFEFLRNDKMDARDFFAATKPELRQNQFGASLGGRILKDRLFFFADYEGFRRVAGTPTPVLVPTACELGRATCNGITQLGNYSDNPATVIHAYPGGPAVPNNVIPLSSITQTSQDYAALYPTAGNCRGVSCNYPGLPNTVQFAHTGDFRTDYRASDKNSLFVRYSINNTDTITQGNVPAVDVAGLTAVQGGGNNFHAGFPGTAYQRQQSFAPGFTHMFGPTVILQLSAQVARYVTDSESANIGRDISTAFGIKNMNNPAYQGVSGLAQLWFFGGDVNGMGDQMALPTIYKDTTYQYNGTVNWSKGAHTIKMGAGIINRLWSVNQQLFKGTFMFFGITGNDFADMLQNMPGNLLRQISLSAPLYKSNEYSGFIQDDWRATHWLTLNVGLRYDIFTPLTEKHNRLSDFDPTNAAMLAKGVIQQAGVNGISATDGMSTQYHDIQPRLGFAATLGRGFVVRGGFGTTYFPDTQASPAYQKNAPFTYNYSGSSGMTSVPAIGVDSTCLVASCGATTGRTVAAAMMTGMQWPAIYMTSMTIEKAFGQNTVSASYVGQFTRHMGLIESNADQPVPPQGPGGCGITTKMSFPSPCQPYYQQIPYVNLIQLLTDLGLVNYNALELQFNRRLQKGLTVSSNYTLTSNLANTGGPGSACTGCNNIIGKPGFDYGPSSFMVKHRFVLTASYVLPFGSNLKGVAGAIGKGWQTNGIYVYSTGTRFVVLDSLDNANVGMSYTQGESERMNVVPAQKFNKGLNEWFDVSQFRQQTYGTAGNEGENPFTNPPNRKVDVSMFKEFRYKEALTGQFRVEVFNLTNTANFASPNTSISGYQSSGLPVTSGTFGQITSTNANATPRQIQFALKLIF